MYNARGSLEEARYLLLLSKALEFINKDKFEQLEAKCEETSKMLNGLIQSLRKHNP